MNKLLLLLLGCILVVSGCEQRKSIKTLTISVDDDSYAFIDEFGTVFAVASNEKELEKLISKSDVRSKIRRNKAIVRYTPDPKFGDNMNMPPERAFIAVAILATETGTSVDIIPIE